MSVDKPDLTQPLLVEPPQALPPAPTSTLGPLQYLVGTWTNQNLPGTTKGDPNSPYSYNLMVLPQVDPTSPSGYILKNFSYYEEVTFTAIHGTAPNRGGMGTQVANTLFYEQRVYFADGPAKDNLIHAENGSWLFLSDRTQLLGPYGDGNGPNVGTKTLPGSTPPTQAFSLIKQMSVPHGNSILASGLFSPIVLGSPVINAPTAVLPIGVDTTPYTTQSVGNPNTTFTLNPNLPLADALNVQPASSYIELRVDSNNGPYPVTNIGYEAQHAAVTRYFANYWLEAFGGSSDFTRLQYSQTILLNIPIAGTMVSFPHITTNTLTKKV